MTIGEGDQPTSASLDGYWEGLAVSQGAALKVRLYFENQDNGFKATIDFPAWNSIGYPLSHVRYEPPLLHFEIAGGKAPDTFAGEVTAESIAGELTLWGRTAQVQLHRTAQQRPYQQEEVAFGEHNVTLAGTLLRPNQGSGPYPAVVLIAGSGPETQDNARGMADHFVRQGVAALIYDKRGTGGSTGHWQEATFADLAQDVIAAVNHLRGRADIQPTQIGLHGTSQGGWIAHLAAAQIPALAFVITIASPVVTPARQVLYEVATRVQQKGFGEDEVFQAIQLKQQFDHYVRTGKKRTELEAVLASAKAARWFPTLEDVPYPLPTFEQLAWWRAVLDFDPLTYVQQAKCPLLAVFGEKDAIVDSQESVEILGGLSAERAMTVEIFAGANHSLMVFPQPHEPFRWFGFADHYLETVASWAKRVLAL